MKKYLILHILIISFVFLLMPVIHAVEEELEQEKNRLLVIPLKVKGGISEDEAALLTDILSVQIYRSSMFTILNRDDMKAVLTEKEFEIAMGCDDNVCLLENVAKLAVNKLVAGNIGKLGEKYIISIRLINENGHNEVMEKESCDCAIEELDKAIERLSYKLLKYLGAEVSTYGSIRVESEPSGAKIYVDGSHLGTTPDVIRYMKPGQHKVEVVMDGYKEWSRRLDVKAGEDNSLRAILQERKIEVGNTGSKSWLGVSIQNLDQSLAEQFDVNVSEGVLITDVQYNSPAKKANIKTGDIVIEYDNKKISNINELTELVAQTVIGKNARVKILRSGKEKILTVKIEKQSKRRERDQFASRDKYSDKATSQRIECLEVSPLAFELIGDGEIRATLNFKNINREGSGLATAFKARFSDNRMDFWKFFPKSDAVVTDNLGNKYDCRSSSGLGFAKTNEDWTMIEAGAEVPVVFTFINSNGIMRGDAFTLSAGIRLVWYPRGSRQTRNSNYNIFLKGLRLNMR